MERRCTFPSSRTADGNSLCLKNKFGIKRITSYSSPCKRFLHQNHCGSTRARRTTLSDLEGPFFEASKCSVTKHLTESTETHSSLKGRQHNSTSRSKKAAVKLHASIPGANSSGLVRCFFVTEQNEFKISSRISPAFPAAPKLPWTARAASVIAWN